MWKREYSTALMGVDDLVNYAFPVHEDPGVILLKDSAFLRAWYFQGPDLDYAVPQELERLSRIVSNAFERCGNGWMLHVHSFRRRHQGYLEPCPFPDPTSRLIDEERRREYEHDGHFTGVTAFALTYKLPPTFEGKLSTYLYAGRRRREPRLDDLLTFYMKNTGEIEDKLGAALGLSPMTMPELLTYLHACVTGIEQPLMMPPEGVDIDTCIADQDLVLGFTPKVGRLHLRAISIDGFPGMTQPGAQDFLHDLTIPYTWSTRFIFMDAAQARRLIDKKRRNWKQKISSLTSKAGEAANGELSDNVNLHALDMAKDAMEAAAEAESGDVNYGLYSMTVLVMDEDEARVDEYAREVQKHIQNRGYGARIEEANAPEALMGTWPGHGYENLRAVPIHSLNLADLLPLTSIWAGQMTVPNPYFAPASPALMLTATVGKTPFAFTPWVGDVGMQLVLGPIGSGKSTLLAMEAVQFRRYPDAQVFWFDKGYSSYPLCLAVGGQHYDIGADAAIAFTPLAGIADPLEREWGLGWLEECLLLQGLSVVSPALRTELWSALSLLGSMQYPLTMTMLLATVQDQTLRTALAHYALGGGAGELLDADHDSLQDSDFLVFEMEHLLNRGDKDLVPVLLYLFHRLEQRLDGRPTLIVIDEAWLMMCRARFGEQVESWLRTLRKKNAAVVFTSQSLSDVERCPQRNIIVESCQTKIFLPNAEADTTQSKQLYLDMGLNEKEITLLRHATPKRHYLYHSPLGRRLFDMHLGPVALSFVGATSRDNIRQIAALEREHGPRWPGVWLSQRGLVGAARAWEQYGHHPHTRKEFAHEPLPVVHDPQPIPDHVWAAWQDRPRNGAMGSL